MNKTQNRGISLIVLIITIIIIIILAGAVILSLETSNPINSANKAAVLDSINSFKDELYMYKILLSTSTLGKFDASKLNADKTGITYTGLGIVDTTNKNIDDIIPSLDNSKYDGDFDVSNGNLKYIGTDKDIIEWISVLDGVDVTPSIIIDTYESEYEGIHFKYTGDWIITTNHPYQGTHSLTNDDIDDGQSTTATFIINVVDATKQYVMAFFDFISSEDDYDYFKVYLNDILVIEETGIDTEYESQLVDLATGDNTVKFVYSKDSSSDDGDDCVYIDNLTVRPKVATPTFTLTPTGSFITTPLGAKWTNSDEIVKITYPDEATLKEYSLDGNIWNVYEGDLSISSNTTIYAKATNSIGFSSASSTLTITEIDKEAPSVETRKLEPSAATITSIFYISDLSYLSGYGYYTGLSGIDVNNTKYIVTTVATKYNVDNEIWNTAKILSIDVGAGIINSGPFTAVETGLANNDYYVQVITTDFAGNKLVTVSDKITVIQTNTLTDPGYISSEGVNAPVLISGMTALKYNSSKYSWEDVLDSVSDTSWYNYANREWANAKTYDGTIWVWIPRYEYKIPTSHISTAQNIDINFLQGASTTVTSGYTINPAFTFGTTEVKGIWVAKFEACNNNKNGSIISNAGLKPYINFSIGSCFTLCRNMETTKGLIYGWGTNGSYLDTHLMKNSEWAAATYLSSSSYGKTGEVSINSYWDGINGMLTGRPSTSASTTGNLFGIYDMSGGTSEFTASYVNNGNINLTTYGYNIIIAESKYKDVYTSSGDTQSGNYSVASSNKGDAVYETSSSYTGTSSWYSDISSMPFGTNPFFVRGGAYNGGSGAGLFNFSYSSGMQSTTTGFRPCLITNSEL